jgi:2-polyprenyl-3-methyl-5-hydroxy-6-metoxy-1,4-benzoquinol methylase
VDVSERLDEQDLERHDYLAASHLHRYAFAAELCADLRVLDLACGIGYGTEMLAERAASAHGVDIDPETIALATARARAGVTFEVADAHESLRTASPDDYDAIVMFEGLEHVPDPEAVLEELERLASGGTRLIVSVPNSRAFRERNPFHVTDFGYADVRRAFGRFDDAEVVYQVFAEGSVILREGVDGDAFRGRVTALEYAEPEYANDFIAVIGFGPDAVQDVTAQLNLVATPAHNRYMLELERANAELRRTNRQLARGIYGKRDAAAATVVDRLEQAKHYAAGLERRVGELELDVRRLRIRMAAPRYRMVDGIIAAVRRVPGVHLAARIVWRVVTGGRGAR